jgi:hypothetical protein
MIKTVSAISIILSLALLAASSVSANDQNNKRAYSEYVKFAGYQVGKTTVEEVEQTCLKQGGTWKVYEDDQILRNCNYGNGGMVKKTSFYSQEPTKPGQIYFWFQANGQRLQQASFLWGNFATWNRAEDTRLALLTSLKGLFPLGVHRVSDGYYVLNSTAHSLRTFVGRQPIANEELYDLTVNIFVDSN